MSNDSSIHLGKLLVNLKPIFRLEVFLSYILNRDKICGSDILDNIIYISIETFKYTENSVIYLN